MLHRWPFIAVFCVLLTFFNSSYAYFSANSFSILYGTKYKVPFSNNSDDSKRTVLTINSTNDNRIGDFFSFIDVSHSWGNGHNNTLYGEFQPRFSVNKIFKQHLSLGPLDDLLLAGQLEYGANSFGFNQLNQLLGAGTNIRAPYFKFIRLNLYRRFNQRASDEWQLSTVWLAPINIASQDFVFTGWFDWVLQSKQRPSNFQTQIQFKWDMGKALWQHKDNVYIGTEFVHWKNKFAIIGVNETVWQAMIQFML